MAAELSVNQIQSEAGPLTKIDAKYTTSRRSYLRLGFDD